MIPELQQGWLNPGWRNRLLLPVAWLYGGLMWCRRRAYHIGLLKQHKASVPVIVVGNISVGGTGKTPLVIALVEYLRKQGFSPGVIARGYGGSSTFWPRGIDDADRASEVGDEPLMVYRRCQVPVVVGPERIRSVHMLIEKYQCNIVVSDDGFQHLVLGRDIDVVVIDGERRFGNGWCLPSGPLREFQGTVKHADFIVVNSSSETVDDETHSMWVESDKLIGLEHPEVTSTLSALADQKVHAVAGLGNPERFFNQLRQSEIEFIPHRFADHHVYRKEDFAFAMKHDILVMTEKDAIKCADLMPDCTVWVLPIYARLNPGFFHLLQSKLDQLDTLNHA